jgi:transposase
MKKRNDTKVIFKPYNQQQTMLLPPSLEELLAANHPVRVVNKVLDQHRYCPFIAKIQGWRHQQVLTPMLLKVLVFAYINNIYSSRKIEEAFSKMFVLCG